MKVHGPSQVLKLLERGLDAMIRRRVEGDFEEEQQAFRKGRGTADEMYVLRQMVEKRLDVQYRAVWLWGSSTGRKLLTQYPERWLCRRCGGWEYQRRK